ncbi:MAG TPA: oligopeptide transporter, OPT family [Blastocatellia bacterium]|nr:oligopeptide transporter, OPT family [Blastocatellia bacterium]
MASEIVDVPKAGANEFPDIVGAKPENPYLATFRPYIPAAVRLRELTTLPIIVGTLLGMVFGASSLYLVLKTGLTVSASIPVAVISITLFRALSKLGMGNATILENNIVQTAGSAGESIAFGVGVTMPAILILGFDLEITRVTLVAVLGGLLGILMMIPLRRALIVQQHGLLKYPEGTACAEVLKAGASDESRAAAAQAAQGGTVAEVRGLPIFTGLGIGFMYKVAYDVFKAWKESPQKIFGAPFKAGSVSVEINPALLGVGYIIGPRIASIMCAGGVLAYLVLIPLIKFFGEGFAGVLAPGDKPIAEMSPNDIRGAYVLYIGAGAVAAGGIISLFRSLPTIWHGLKGGISDFRGGQAARAGLVRTDQDLSMKFVVGGVILLLLLIILFPQLGLHWNILGAVLIVAFGFLFVTVSSRLTGEIGSSSNPISGMTVATLLLTCLIFLLVGWTGPPYFVTALSIGGIVCIAASNGGTTSQDLKTGFLVGSTPKYQQIAILVGALASALILGPILLKLNDAGTVYVPHTTFEEVGDKQARVDAQPLATLAPTTDITGLPPGDYRTFKNEKDSPNQIKELDPGEYLVDASGNILYKVDRNFPPDMRIDPGVDPAQLKRESLKGPQAQYDPKEYLAWHKFNPTTGSSTKYMVDPDTGEVKYLADPAINGTHKRYPTGGGATKFDAPKAVLMSYIINGILSHKLPWALVLLGVMIAIVLEMSGIPSLAFAVGVYLPLSSSSPIFIGGLIRLLVDKYVRQKFAKDELSEDQLVAEGDKSAGVLMASGYIAGAALAGIIFAVMNGYPALAGFNSRIEAWAGANNPFFKGDFSDLLSLIPFVIICVLLYLAGREVILAGKKSDART